MAESAKSKTRAKEILQQFEAAKGGVVQVLETLLREELISEAQLINVVGFDELMMRVPPSIRTQIVATAVAMGRQGKPFDDAALLSIATPGMIARFLPLANLQLVVKQLCDGRNHSPTDRQIPVGPVSQAKPPPLPSAPPSGSVSDKIPSLTEPTAAAKAGRPTPPPLPPSETRLAAVAESPSYDKETISAIPSARRSSVPPESDMPSSAVQVDSKDLSPSSEVEEDGLEVLGDEDLAPPSIAPGPLLREALASMNEPGEEIKPDEVDETPTTQNSPGQSS